ncbi:MAG: redoxin family protein, partial [Rhodospirillales bacterium]
MTIKVGDAIPSLTLYAFGADGPESVLTDDIFKGKKVVMFGLPGAFTPTCSARHLPGYMAKAEALRAKGVDAIVCLSVNNAFVMGAWGVGASIGIMVLHSFVPFPAELVAFANGMIYGPFWGTVITWTG